MQAIRCAHADLVGALQAHNQDEYGLHNWTSHRTSILELENEFQDVITAQDRLPLEDDE
jgi:hypothetical protein